MQQASGQSRKYRKPNFLIVGAAKAGTTSLAKYLNGLTDIFIPEIKEPRFMVAKNIQKVSTKDPSFNYLKSSSILNKENYFSLFKDRNEKLIGEASVHYLYHYAEAVPNILHHLGDIKIIILLRNPVHRAISNYKYQNKDFLTFGEALAKEDIRMMESFNSFWYYKNLGFYYAQVKAYLNNFRNVKVILFEDFVKDTDKTMCEVCEFLNVDHEIRPKEYKKYNDSSVAVVPKNKILKSLLKTQNSINLFERLAQKRWFPPKLYINKKSLITELDYADLLKEYESDIKNLEDLIQKDLSSWLQIN